MTMWKNLCLKRLYVFGTREAHKDYVQVFKHAINFDVPTSYTFTLHFTKRVLLKHM